VKMGVVGFRVSVFAGAAAGAASVDRALSAKRAQIAHVIIRMYMTTSG
jgi:hypothetical protein